MRVPIWQKLVKYYHYYLKGYHMKKTVLPVYEGEERRSVHMNCLAHSGLNTKINLLLVLTSIATLAVTIAVPMLSNIQKDVATNSSSLGKVEKRQDKLEDRVLKLEQKYGGLHDGP